MKVLLLLLLGVVVDCAKQRIIDTHVHLSDVSRFQYVEGWCKTTHSKADYYKDMQASAFLSTAHAVFVEASVLPTQNVKEVEWVQNQTDSPPFNIGAINGFLPLGDGKAILPDLQKMLKAGNFRGVRAILNPELDDPCPFLTTDFLDALRILDEHRLVFELLTRTPEQWSCALDLIRQAPRTLSVTLEHMGGPNMTMAPADPDFGQWKKYIIEMAKFKNVVAKVSGVPERSVLVFDKWSMDKVAPYIDHVISSFGYDRSMFGGNWFVVKTFSTFQRWADALYTHLQTLKVSDKDLDALFYGTAERHYKIGH